MVRYEFKHRMREHLKWNRENESKMENKINELLLASTFLISELYALV